MLERQWRAQAADLEGRPAPAEAEPLQPRRPALALPGLPGADPRHPQHPGPELARAARPLRRLPRADFGPLSARRARDRHRLRRGRLAFRLRACRRCLALVFTAYLIALTGIDIDRQLLPDILTVPLLWIGLVASLWHVAGGAAPPAALRDAVIGAVGGLRLPLARVPALQAGHRQGRHGLRRLQALRRDRRLARLADAAARAAARRRRRRGGRHRDDGGAPARARRADSLRALPRRRGVDRAAVGPATSSSATSRFAGLG